MKITHPLINAIDKSHEERAGEPRPYLGGSAIGEKCDRRLWYAFRWAVKETFSGRLLRLFRRGHREEETVLADLKAIGLEVTNTQLRFSLGPHSSGACDGTTIYKDKPHIIEIKTHNDKNFKLLSKDGIPHKHYVQMQLYMYGAKMSRALYIAVNKNDDELFIERVKIDTKFVNEQIERAQRIIFSEMAPDRINADPTWWECKFCPALSMCKKKRNGTEVNCRTCCHATPEKDSTWFCEKWQKTIPEAGQRIGCNAHSIHPDMVPEWTLKDSNEDFIAVYEIDGKEYKNGQGHYLSKELIGGPDVMAVVKAFSGEVKTVSE